MLLGKEQGQSPQGTDESSQELGKRKGKKLLFLGVRQETRKAQTIRDP